MLWKLTVLFENGKYGWSETYGTDVASLPNATLKGLNLIAKRKQILAHPAAIVGLRTSSADPEDPQTALAKIPVKDGTTNLAFSSSSDIPWNGVLCRAISAGQRKPISRILRGIPDDYLGGSDTLIGQFQPESNWQNAFEKFATFLIGDYGTIVKRDEVPAPGLVFLQFSNYEWTGPAHRQTGRPFGLPVGRRRRPAEAP